MATYILLWDPRHESWEDYDDCVQATNNGMNVAVPCHCKGAEDIKAGDRVFLFRKKVEPRGLVGAGIASSDSYHGNTLVDVDFDKLVPLADVSGAAGALWAARFNFHALRDSAVPVARHLEKQVEEFWTNQLADLEKEARAFAGEVSDPKTYAEGATAVRYVNAYERSVSARKACVAHYGMDCAVCGFNFEKTFGSIGEGFIHVHHLKPLGQIDKAYKVDPIKDLRPVCPNCHAMLHIGERVFSIRELKAILKKHGARR